MLRPNGVEELARSVREFELSRGFTVLVAPRRAEELFKEGCKTLADVEEYIWKKITLPIGQLRKAQKFGSVLRDMEEGKMPWPEDYATKGDEAEVQVFPRDGANIIVVGDPQGSNVMQGWSMYAPKSTSIDKWR